MGRRVVAEIALPGADVQIPPAVYAELVTRLGARPDALKAAELITAGHIRVADTTALQGRAHHHLAQACTAPDPLLGRGGQRCLVYPLWPAWLANPHLSR